MISNSILNAYKLAKQRNWTNLYWAIDIHGTILVPNYSKEIPIEFYKNAEDILRKISNRKDSTLILYTCSHPEEIVQYLEFFKNKGINFKYVNSNPEVPDNAYGYFKEKFYFNILLEDKAGFDPTIDWDTINETLNKIEIL